jgi:PEP-CTERM motif
MKKITLIAGLASVGAVAAVLWTVPVVASTTCSVGCSHETRSGREDRIVRNEGDDDTSTSTSTSVPEPGTLALLGLGLSGLGLTGLGRKRTKK